jgi:hypothetical protein
VLNHGLNQLSAAEVQLGVAAFNGLAGYLGAGWVERQIPAVRSPLVVIWANDLWRDIETLRHLSGLEPILKRLTGTHCPAATEIHVAASLTRQGREVELEPEVGGNKPDLRFRVTERWLYMEIVRRDIESVLRSTNRILNQLAGVLVDIESRGHGMVTLLRPGTGLDVDAVVRWLKSGPASGAILTGEAAFDLLPEDQGPSTTAQKHGSGPWMYATRLQTSPLSPLKRGTAAMPVIDESKQRLLSHEARQLPKTEPSVVLIDVGAFPGGPKSWEPVLRSRLTRAHRRVGAIVVHSRLHGFDGVANRGLLIRNPKARIPLDDQELQSLNDLTSEMLPR